ncbi:MAG: hypothetical protein N2445_01000 [Acidobacteria bacterium]|nr:hypothetical protein [Acidobacteriota bacterium]
MPFPVGSARGEAESLFLISVQNKDFSIPSIEINGFSQKTRKGSVGEEIEIKITADSLRIDKEWVLDKKISKELKNFDPKRAALLIDSLLKIRYADEAILTLFKFVRDNWNYCEKNDGDLSINEILLLKEASCLSFCKLCKAYLDILGIECELALGIKFPSDKDTIILKGGALHSWLKIKIDQKTEIFCDPLSFFGFVTHRYIYLSNEENFKKNKLQEFKDALVILASSKDRIFYNPESEIKPMFWRRSVHESSIYGLILGKVLKEKDIPFKGKIVLETSGNYLENELFEGNFYFFIKGEGEYSFFVVMEGKNLKKIGDLVFAGNSVKKVVYYIE